MSALAGANVLVTGGAGFIGSHIAETLAVDNDVRVLDRCSTGSPEAVPPDATFIEGDVLDERTLASAADGVDVIFHQAALASVADSVADPMESHRNNETGTVAVLDAARRADARVVLASSAAVYGPPTSLPVCETEPTRPRSPYGVGKLAVDHYARVYADRYGLWTAALRYFNVYGPGANSGVVAAFLDGIQEGEIAVHGDGTQTRDFVHVSDVVRANVLAATRETDATAFNVGTGSAVSIGQLANRIQQETNVDVTYTESRAGDIEHSRADLSRARDQLGYEPRVAIEDGIDTLVSNREPVAGTTEQ